MTNAIDLTPKTTAALIRTILKGAFPATKFSVTTARGSMVSAVDVRWTDGPTTNAVDALVKVFADGHFDGMTDCHEYATGVDRFVIVNGVTYTKGTRYVSTSRKTSRKLAERAAAQVAAYYGVAAPVIGVNLWGGWTVENDHTARAFTGHYDWSDLIYQATGDRTRFAA